MEKPSIYLETSVISYYTARRSRDISSIYHQDITRSWWESYRHNYTVYISAAVIDEIRRGDTEAANQRLKSVDEFVLLPILPECEQLAFRYARDLKLPAKALYDALHIAIATVHEVEYLVTWNCAHIANAHIRRGLQQINESEGRPSPVICTPEELLQDEQF